MLNTTVLVPAAVTKLPCHKLQWGSRVADSNARPPNPQ